MKVKALSILEANEAIIVERVRQCEGLSRSDLARDLGLSPATVSRAVRNLILGGALYEVGPAAPTLGRPAILLKYNQLQGLIVAVDVGGTMCRTSLTDLEGEPLYAAATPIHQDCGDPLDIVYRLIEQTLTHARDLPMPVKALGVGVPGIVRHPDGVVSRSPTPGWEGVPVGRLLLKRFHIPVIVENDVNLAALGEAWRGTAKGMTNFVVLSIGTGIGASIVVGGELVRGFHYAAGEVGSIVTGSAALSGSIDHWETLEALASAPAIVRHLTEIIKRDPRPTPLRDNLQLQAEQIFQAYHTGDWAATAVIQELVGYIAVLLSNIAAILDPEMVILGGSMGIAVQEILPAVLAQVARLAPMSSLVKVSTLGSQATLLGATSAALGLARKTA